MEEKKYINPDTITHIQNYLSIPSPPGLILAGIDGLGKKESAYCPLYTFDAADEKGGVDIGGLRLLLKTNCNTHLRRSS